MSRPRIDLQELRSRLRLQKNHTIFAMLDEALELLPPARLEQLVSRYMSIDELGLRGPEPQADTPSRLRAAVESFVATSRAGGYFETFNVNSKNCTEQSKGTTAWIGECDRLLDRCVALAGRRRGAADVFAAFELMFEVIEQAASCELDIVFFADEGGIWEFGIDWGRVGNAWLQCLSLAKVEGTRVQRVAQTLERCGGQRGGVGGELARIVRRSGLPLD